MLMPRYTTNQSNERVKSAGIFVQCEPDGEGTSWSCQAHARITLKGLNKGEDFTRSKSDGEFKYFNSSSLALKRSV